MEESAYNNLESKIQIAEAAARLYVKNNGSFTMHDIARATDLTVSEVLRLFADKESIVYFYYHSLLIRYRMMIGEIEGFAEFTLSEKLSNFAYTSFDMLEEHEAFVEQTFRAYILHSCRTSDFEEEIESLFRDFFEHDPGKAASTDLFINDCSMRLIRRKYLHLLDFWLRDDSEGKEVTLELTDKVTGLIEEALYTSVIDRSFDLAKFLYANDVLSKKVPLWDRLTNSFEIR